MIKWFYCHNHQGKADAYIRALQEAGWRQGRNKRSAKFFLSDIDFLSRARLVDQFHLMGKPTFIYPHTGRPMIQWDGMYPSHRHTKAVFTIGKGGVEVMRRYGLQKPVHAVGWTYCELRPFRPCEDPKKILFAPIHVNGNGFMTDRESQTNAKVYRRLLEAREAHGLELTVRYLHELGWNGLWEVPGVRFVRGRPDQSTAEIDAADVVVSHQNMAYLAIARGVPTLMMAEDLVPISANKPDNVTNPKTWPKYKDLLMYPLDILAGDDTMELCRHAAADDASIAEWRENFIGDPFNGPRFVEILESYL